MKIINTILTTLLVILKPLLTVLTALWQLIQAILTTIFGIPAEAASVFAGRLSKRADNMDAALTAKADEKKKRSLAKDLEVALERLYYSDDFILHTKQVRRVKTFLILLLEITSFFTTYRGLNQVMAAIHPAVPLLLTLVIQLGLTYLATTVTYEGAAWSQKILLSLLLTISIAFSFVGVTETLLPYADYAESAYTDFADIYESVQIAGQQSVEHGSNPAAEVEAQYSKIGQLLSDAWDQYSDQIMKEAQDTLVSYEQMTVAVTVEAPTYSYRDPDGNLIQSGGGTKVQYVPDPDAKPLIQAAKEHISFIEEQQNRIVQIEALLSAEGNLESVLNVLEMQMANPNTLLSEFTTACGIMETLSQKCVELSKKMNSSLIVELDLYAIFQGYRKSSHVYTVDDIPAFQDLYEQWQEAEYKPTETGIDVLDNNLAAITVNDPSQLKELLEQSVSDHYHRLAASMTYIGENTSAQKLHAAYENFHLDAPINYAFCSLLPSSENFKVAILAAIVALCNDGLAVAIGLWMEQRRLSWTKNRALSRANLAPHLYPHFRAVVLPLIRKRISGSFNYENIRRTLSDILEDFLGSFALAPQLVESGFTRYYKLSPTNREFDGLLSFLLVWQLAEDVSPEKAAVMGISGTNDDTRYLLLSAKGEGFLTDLLGSACEVNFGDLSPSL